MKALIRLKGKIRPEKQQSAVSYQQSELSCQRQAINHHLPWLIPITYYLISILILVFVSCGAALAQESVVNTTPAAKADIEITPLEIGDRVPDALWKMTFPVVFANSDEVQYLSLGDYKDKLIILDFWATWCAPCISSLHKLDNLQEQFKEDLMVIPTSYESESKVRPFLEHRAISLSTLIEENFLKEYFPHRSIPHQVWLKDGEVLAITGPEYANKENVGNVISGVSVPMIMIGNENYDVSIPTTSREPDEILLESVFSKAVKARIGGIQRRENGIKIINHNLLGIIKEAFQTEIGLLDQVNRILFETNSTLRDKIDFKFSDYTGNYQKDLELTDLFQNNTFCYSLEFPKPTTKDVIYKTMQNSLKDFLFNYYNVKVSVEKKRVKCFIVKMEEREDLIRTKGEPGSFIMDNHYLQLKNRPFNIFINSLNTAMIHQFLIIDETGYQDNIDIQINGDLSDVSNVRDELKQYGLTLEEGVRNIEMIVISEINSPN